MGGANEGKWKSLKFQKQLLKKTNFSFQIYNEAECQERWPTLKVQIAWQEGRRQVLPMTLELRFLRHRKSVSKINVMLDGFDIHWKPLGKCFKLFAFSTFFLVKYKEGLYHLKPKYQGLPWWQSQSLFIEWAWSWALAICFLYFQNTYQLSESQFMCLTTSMLYCKIKHSFSPCTPSFQWGVLTLQIYWSNLATVPTDLSLYSCNTHLTVKHVVPF